jgi:hypothetical protein
MEKQEIMKNALISAEESLYAVLCNEDKALNNLKNVNWDAVRAAHKEVRRALMSNVLPLELFK